MGELPPAISRKALELDAALAEAHAARGLAVSLEKKYDEAAKEFERAIELNPHFFFYHYNANLQKIFYIYSVNLQF